MMGGGINLTQLLISDPADNDVAVYLSHVPDKNYKFVPLWGTAATESLEIDKERGEMHNRSTLCNHNQLGFNVTSSQ